MPRFTTINDDFTCIHCRRPVPAGRLWSNTLNRNHCPYCLWSRHLDLYRPGDRLCACKGAMRPVGLTLKQARKRYPGRGELMLIHRCEDCGRLSINRIAADDDPETLLGVFETSFSLDAPARALIEQSGIRALSPADRRAVTAQLYGSA